jgi:hypothetical protein
MELQSSKAEESRRQLLCGELDAPGLRASLMVRNIICLVNCKLKAKLLVPINT